MEVYAEKAPVFVSAAKVLLAAVGPAQRLVQKPAITHIFCNRQAQIILDKDGYKDYALLVAEYLPILDEGVVWADQGFRNLAHFFNPRTHKGLSTWSHAAGECSIYWNKAVVYWRDRDYTNAFFYLGAALHLVQDLCEPHHAMGMLLDGHKSYETWVEERSYRFGVEQGGIYNLGRYPRDWVQANALVAIRNYHLVRADSKEQDYIKATENLLTRTQQVTAGFIQYFLSSVNFKNKTWAVIGPCS